MGEVARAIPGMTRETANRIVTCLLSKYEDHLEDAPPGGTYRDLYDVAADQPKPEYLRLYQEVKEGLAGLEVGWK